MSAYTIESPNGLKIPVLDVDPTGPLDGVIWYNSAENAFKKQENGSTVDLADADVFDNAVLLNNQSSIILLTYPTSFRASIIKYYIERDGNVQAGNLNIATNGIIASITDENTSTLDVGITFSVDVSAGNVNLRYTSTSTGFNANIKYSLTEW